MLDSFFAAAGAPECLRRENPLLALIGISTPQDAAPEPAFFYDHLSLPELDAGAIRTRIFSWLGKPNTQFLFEQRRPEFGAGLWVELALRSGLVQSAA